MKKNRKAYLKAGALLLSGGLLAMYITVYEPLQTALNGSSSITTYLVGPAIALLMTILGVACIFFPKFVDQYLVYTGQKMSDAEANIGLAFIIVSLVISIGLAIWVQSFLHRLGYE